MSDIVYGAVGSGFGDLWASVHWVLRLAERTGQRQRFSVHAGTDPYRDERKRIEEMIASTDGPTDLLTLEDALPTRGIGYDCWTAKLFPAKHRWSPRTCIPGVIGYQFDGRSTSEAKNPPPADVERFLLWCVSGGLNAARVGTPFTIDACARMLQLAEVFVGCCSGMSLLAISVGLPVYVVSYRMGGVSYWYGPNQHTPCADLEGFAREYDRLHGLGEDGLPFGHWKMDNGPLITLHHGGGARWQDQTHAISGVWGGNPPVVRWANGFTYTLDYIGAARARVTQRSPTGSETMNFAVRGEKL